MRSEIEKLGYVVVVHRVGGGVFQATAFSVKNWMLDRKVRAATEEDAIEALHALIVPRDGRPAPDMTELQKPIAERGTFSIRNIGTPPNPEPPPSPR